MRYYKRNGELYRDRDTKRPNQPRRDRDLDVSSPRRHDEQQNEKDGTRLAKRHA
jgi:hypothetical protein